MVDKRVKISSIIENQLPSFVREEFPLVSEFLSQYYNSLESPGGVSDLLQNIDRYVKLEQLTNLVDSTTTISSVGFGDDTISVTTTKGFPESYGLLKIGSEIITYKSKTNTTFNECVRGFSGTSSYQNPSKPDQLVFSSTEIQEHESGALVSNLSILFLKEFFRKVKKQFAPGFDERDLFAGLNQNLFIKQAKDFYSSKGTDQSFEILFRALYGEDVEVVKPSDYLFIPSDAQYRIAKDLVVEALDGNPFDLNNRTLYQDADPYNKKAYGSINNVEKITRGDKDYYVISLDYDPNVDNDQVSDVADFPIHSQTKIITTAPIGSTVIDVDSTVGFPNSGTLVVGFDNGSSIDIIYTSKSYTQFYGCSGVTQELVSGQDIRINSYAYGYSGSGTDNIVKLRITGVLSNLRYDPKTKYYDADNSVQIKTIGKDSSDVRANNWIFNIATSYDIETLVLADSINFSYRIVTSDNHSVFVGNKVKLILTDSTEIVTSVIEVLNEKSFIIGGQGQIDINKKYKVQKIISKAEAVNFSSVSNYSTDVQNTYQDENDSFYVTSSSLPNYLNQPLSIKNKSVIFSGTFVGTELNIGAHGFYTGDAVFYSGSPNSNLGITNQIYFVKRINSTTIKLARSGSNLYNEKYISFNSTVTNNTIVFNDFANQTLDSQRLIRNIKTPEKPNKLVETTPGPLGILVNGVEILNYKSRDKIFYGPLEKIDVLSPGSNYDVTNPPVLTITDSDGSGAVGYCGVEGQIQEIQVVDGGFDYVTDPIITVTGGSGSGVQAKAQLLEFQHSVTFNSSSAAGEVDLSENKIGFSTYHKFRNAEKIIYKPEGQQAIGGLGTDSVYYASIQDEFSVKLHNSYNDALSNTNPIDLTSYGNGNHRFVSFDFKKKISSVVITDKGSTFKNRKISISPVGVNTFSNIINAKNHGYSTGDIVEYKTTGSEIGGLVSGKSYYLTSVDENSFRLSEIGSSTSIGIGSATVGVSTISDFYFKSKQYIDLTGIGTGGHVFNYPPIKVDVSGKVGVSTFSQLELERNFNAVLQPIVRGEIKSVFLESGGSNYGSEDILNFNKQPSLTLQSGSGAEVLPVISNGTIVEVLVISPGSGYNSPPSLVISGSGVGARLTPIISNGSLSEVKVINGGVEYRNISINVASAGAGAEFRSTPKQWSINLVERNIKSNQITDDDGIIDSGINSNYGLQYTHLYAPRKLRQTIYSQEVINGKVAYLPDLRLVNGKEVLSDSHSPIIGWAYDGNPIYGPYGYSSISGGSVKAIESGYSISLKPDRPSTSIFPEGFFIEDYSYLGKGDLDEHNGRFCITPEFPKGVYAYFATINSVDIESSPPFRNYRKPVFPYFVGDKFKSKTINYNFAPSSNQDNIDLRNTKLFRNTTPYNLLKSYSGYDFIVEPNKIKKQTSLIRYAKPGGIDSIGIKTGGTNYKVNDPVIFDNSRSGGQGASAKVSYIKGKNVNEISVNTISISNVEFVNSANGTIGFATLPHNLSQLDLVTITGLNTSTSRIDGTYNIGVRSDTFSLLVGVGTTVATGIVTYFSVFGTLNYPIIRENDILTIDSEKVKVLNIDAESSRIRVLREFNNSVSSAHTESTLLYEDSRKFYFDPNIKPPNAYNREIYFDPIESVGIGTTAGVGIGVTLFFSNPGIGVSNIFIPTRSIYLRNHNLSTGDELLYSSNGGSPLSVSTNGIDSYQLVDEQIVYTAKISDDLIGISTNKVGLGSTGSFVGIDSSANTSILYLTNIGSGKIHSFTTNYKNVVVGQVSKNLVTVSMAQTHGLNVNDNIIVSCLSGISTTYVIKYNDYNRRLIANPKTFLAGDVDASNDTIQIVSHGYVTGQKVIHNAAIPSGGLENESIYFIIRVDDNRIKLAKSYFDSISNIPVSINLTSASSGTLSLVNPPIIGTKNQEIIFDVSDSSLSYRISFNNYPAFEFNLYTDPQFKDIFESKQKSGEFVVERSGIIGVDPNATVSIKLSDDVPNILYYQLIPVDYDTNDQSKLEIISDSENILDNNRLLINPSFYSGNYSISGIGSTTFTYNLSRKPERSAYTNLEASISYKTDSKTAFGEIQNIEIDSSGSEYKFLPTITRVDSLLGSGAVLEASSSTIGKISSTEIIDIGFEYPTDFTLRPTAKIPQVLKLVALSSFERIGISSVGKKYTIAPNLVVIDSVTKKVIDDLDLRYNLRDKEVTILKNTKGINNLTPIIIPTNNSNGVGINSITYNEATKEVTVGLAVSYSSSADYPFSIGDKVIIENTSVGIGTSLRGYNSSSYEYSLFTLNGIDPNIGGANGTVTYSLEGYLPSGENPGNFNLALSSGKITPQKFFPVFDVKLKKNQFKIDETVSTPTASGKVEKWYPNTEILVVSSIDDFKSGDTLIGESSQTRSVIESVFSYEAHYDVSSSSIVKKGWKLETGFLNNDYQRLHDSDYYQYFSYALRSKVEYETWKDPISSMNHTVGFKKFSDLIVESKDSISSGITTEQNSGDFTSSVDLISEINLNCVNDFDLARENSLNIGSETVSDQIIFNSTTIQDYFESVGNRVLTIDDISINFNSNPRPTQFSVVDLFELTSTRSRKYIAYVVDKRFIKEKQISLITLLHNDLFGFLNQYGRVDTVGDLGSFDFIISGTEGRLLFYPTKYQINDYNVNIFSYDIRDTISGIGTINLGDTVKISSNTKTIPVGFSTTTTLVGIASTYRSSKILIQYSASDDSYYEYDELTVIHDGSTVDMIEYGQLSTDILTPLGSIGIGTYGVRLSGSEVKIDFTPNVGLGVTYYVNSIAVSIANTSSSGISSSTLRTGQIESSVTSIGSTSSPIANVVSEYQTPYSGAYYIVSVEDTTNQQYQVSEIVVVDDGITASLTEFAVLQTGSNIGSFDVTISGGKTQLTFTPISNASTQIRVFKNALRMYNEDLTESIDLTNALVGTGNGTYEGTESDIRRVFDLKHKGLPIFRRNINGNSSSIVDVDNNLIRIPNHYFVTGEELLYTSPSQGTSQSIGISTVSIVGLGTTDKMPQTVYAIKVTDASISLASSVENALKTVPIPLIISSVGIGTSHALTSKKQNSKVLISIDNVIQSPVVATSLTSILLKEISPADQTITVSGITSFFAGDLIEVNNEIMRIDAVGLGSTNVFLVKRPWMGTGISSHSNGSLVTKISGNYNIVDNTINFVTAPYGQVPIGTVTDGPSNVDYLGISTYSTFSGRSFIRSGIPDTDKEPYSNNYIFNDISSQFTGYSTSFTLKSNEQNVTGFSTDNAVILINQIFQGPQKLVPEINFVSDYVLRENSGITNIQFSGSISSTSYDVNNGNLPRGGIIVSVGSSKGFGYQPLVSAGGTAIISGLGTVSSVSIGNSGSGYRSGVQTVRVGVKTENLENVRITYIGTATISGGNVVSVAITNPGTGYTSSNPPIVVFDDPLSYSNIPLVYSSSSSGTGFGTGAKVNVVVGQGSSVIDFEITNFGYGYGQGEVLTVGMGGTVGIPTDTSLAYSEFKLIIDKTLSDSFSGWTFGNLLVLDPLDQLFDGIAKSFQITVNGLPRSIRSKTGSNIDVETTLLVFINDVLQVPGEGYIFNGGSFIDFTEPPKVGDKSKILFYQGTSLVDVINVDILETIKPGDTIRLSDDKVQYDQNERLVSKIVSIDTLRTNSYKGPGLANDQGYNRSVIWCKQTEDMFIDGKEIAKDRVLYEPLIYPNTKIIQSVGTASTIIFVESVKTFFDSAKENYTGQNKIRLVSQDNIIGAEATAVVSVAGTISSISITNSGIGYTVSPTVIIANPVGLGSTQRASATAAVSSGSITSITVSSPGTGYTSTNPPSVLIDLPSSSNYVEDISSISYSGDFGIISGISTTSVGVASTAIVFDLVIPQNSFLRNSSIVGTAITISGIQTGYYFVVYNSNVGSGVTSLRNDGSIVSIGNSFLDNVYHVSAVSIAQTTVNGFVDTYVAQVTVSVSDYNGLSDIGYDNFFGEYSWGRILSPSRQNPKSFSYYNNGLSGISTSTIVERYNPLKYLNYV